MTKLVNVLNMIIVCAMFAFICGTVLNELAHYDGQAVKRGIIKVLTENGNFK